MGLQIRALFEPLRSLAFGSISGAYTAIGTPLANPSRIMVIQNLTNAQITFSFDGIHDALTLPANGQIVIDFTANHNISMQFYIAQNVTVYAKETSGAPTSGDVYVSTIYGAQ